MKYRSKHLISCNNLFCNFDMKKLTGKGNIKRTYKCADKNSLAKQIFLRYLHILFTDFVQGGKTILFPTPKYLELRMRRIDTHRLAKARKTGAFQELDVLMSGMVHYEPVVSHKIQGQQINVAVKLSDNFRDAIITKVNTGYKYC